MIEIVDYRPTWAEEFQAIAGRLGAVLGPLAVRIDHIGSTSVPGLAAKDIIDVQISVRALSDDIVVCMTSNGYQHRPDITRDHCPPDLVDDPAEWAKMYFNPPPDERRTNIHVRLLGRPNQRYALLFRDYLRAHPAATAGYAELKRRLAQLAGDDRDAYTDTKDPVCDIIMAAAEEWAAQIGWG